MSKQQSFTAAELPSVDEETGRRIEPRIVSRSAAETLRYSLGGQLLQHLQTTASSQEDRRLLQSSDPSLNTIRPGVRKILDRFQSAGEHWPCDLIVILIMAMQSMPYSDRHEIQIGVILCSVMAGPAQGLQVDLLACFLCAVAHWWAKGVSAVH